jgi:ABC-type multidrug transport system ATPase subunit
LEHFSLIIMNEPTYNIDIEYRQIIWELIFSIKVTSITALHSLEKIKLLSSWLFIFTDGKLIIKEY